jgi:hypothetical protein
MRYIGIILKKEEAWVPKAPGEGLGWECDDE